MKVLVALSGGSESLVTAWLLKKQGMQLRGIYLDILGLESRDEKIAAIERKLGFSIQIISVKEEVSKIISAARDEARALGQIFDEKEFFHQKLLFPKLFELKEQHQFTKVATGHRVLVQEDPVAGLSRIIRYPDLALDESKLLLGLKQSELGSLIVPLGSIPESMMHKLTLELDPKNECKAFDFDWPSWSTQLPAKVASSGFGFDVVTTQGMHLGSMKENHEIKLGSFFSDPENTGAQYRIIDFSPQAQKILVTKDEERRVRELYFSEGSWFTRSDLKMGTFECQMVFQGREKSVGIQLIQYEGNRLRGVLKEPLLGEAANIFAGQTVLWIEGQEVVGGGKVLRTK